MSQDATHSEPAMSRDEAWKGLRDQLRDQNEPPVGANLGLARAAAGEHIVWFDYAKGICILLVVMMHSTLGVEKAMGAEGFMHYVVQFAKPFRMPDFYLLAGLFLFRMIDRDWRTYLDRKLLHFAYFYVLWLVILMAMKEGGLLVSDPQAWFTEFATAFVQPNPNLWFIYVLSMFFILTKLVRAVGIPDWALWFAAAAAQTFTMHTGWQAIDDYGAHYYVFFLTGYMLAPRVFKIAAWARENMGLAMICLSGWFVANSVVAFEPAGIEGVDYMVQVPVVSIVFGLMGAVAVVTLASLLSNFNAARFIRYAGQNSIVIYVSFVLPMAATRMVLLKTGVIEDPGVVALIVWLVAASVPLALHALVRNTPARYLYERPAALKIERKSPRHAARANEAVVGRGIPQGRSIETMAVPGGGRRN